MQSQGVPFKCEERCFMKIYRLSDEGFNPIIRRVLTHLVISGVVVTTVLMVASFLSQEPFSIGSEVFRVAILFTVLFFVGRKTVNQQKQIWESYELELSENYLIKRQDRLEDITIVKTDITEIVENNEGNLIVKTDDIYQNLIVLQAMEGFEEVKSELSQLREIKTEDPRGIKNAKYQQVLFFIALGILLFARTPYIVIPLALGLILLLIWSIIQILRSPHYEVNAKIASFAALTLFLMFTGYKLFLVLYQFRISTGIR